MPELILVRHAATDMAGRFCGQSDPPINAAGARQVHVLVNALGAWKAGYIYSSDLQRALQTAEAISNAFAVPLKLRSSLREIHFGQWEGLLWRDIEKQSPDLANLWIREYPHRSAPEGEDYVQFLSRVIPESELLFQHAQADRIIVVTHAGVMREILMRQCKVSDIDAWQWTKRYGAFVVINEEKHVVSHSVANEVSYEHCDKTR
jgi:broad specificity phosphatase PhoE